MTMPNFLLIGAAKAGTSSLFFYLKQNPQIYMPSGFQKEPDFFALEGEKLEYPAPRGTFVMKNRVTDLQSYQALFDDATTEKAIGEASTLYIYSEKAPHRIKHYIPEAKIIAILRDPVERAFSHYLYWTSQGFEPDTDYNFAKALAAEPDRIQAGWSHNWHYVRRGFYYQQLKRYYDLFDREQIKVVLYEDLIRDRVGLCEELFDFLEVDASWEPKVNRVFNKTEAPKNNTLNFFLNRPNLAKSIAKKIIPASIRKPLAEKLKQQNKGKPKLSRQIRNQLMEVYREDILQLQDLIHRDLSSWLK